MAKKFLSIVDGYPKGESIAIDDVTNLSTTLSGYEVTSNKKTDLSDNSDTFYPTQKAVKTVTDALAHASFYATTMTVNTGTLIAGTVTDLQAVGGTDVDIQEAAGADPLRVTFDFTGVTRLSSFAFYGNYDGGAAHQMSVEIYNVGTTNWDVLGIIGIDTVKAWYSFSIFNISSYINAGAVSVRLRHVQSGVNTHNMIFDYVELNYGGAGGQSNIAASAVTFTPTGNIAATNVQSAIAELDSEKVIGNTAITGATKTKITYDAKGLVTAGADLAASDLPTAIDATKIANGNVTNTEFQYLDGVTSAIQTQLSAKMDDLNVTTGTSLTIDFATYNYHIITISGNASFSLSNVPTNKFVTVLVKNTAGGVVTLPNTADVKSALTFTHAANKWREYSILYDGTTRYWQVSEELT